MLKTILQFKYLYHFLLMATGHSLVAQKYLPLIKATKSSAIIRDGNNVKIAWKLDPDAKPDVYYVNVPSKDSRVSLTTDSEEISFKTRYGRTYDFIVLLNSKDSCFVRIVAAEPPSSVSMHMEKRYPVTIPFVMTGSRVYFKGVLNGQKEIYIQFDLGAGGAVVNKFSSKNLQLIYDQKTVVSNTQGVNEARSSTGNELKIGDFTWKGIPITEVGNMKAYEDLIIGNGLFRDKIIEIDYDKMILIVHENLPGYSKEYKKQEVFYEQDRPKFMAKFTQNGIKYAFWCLFDTGREGTMLIGEDFTIQGQNWSNLKELEIINGRKIVLLDAIIGGKTFKNIVTNAADPSKPQGRPTLLGNQILNQFNVILDNQKGVIYLKPNKRGNQPYSDYKSYLEEKAKR